MKLPQNGYRAGSLFSLCRFGAIAIVSAVFVLLTAAPRPLLAEEEKPLMCPKKLTDAEAIKKRAGRLFQKGEMAFKGKKYKMALQRFLCSMYILEHEATITNIERVIAELTNKEQALELIEAYLELNPEGELNSKMKEIQKNLQRGMGIAPAEEPQKETVCPECPPAPLPVSCPPLPDVAPFEAAHASSQKNLKIFGWTTTGVGAASIVAGVVLQVLAVTGTRPASTTNKFQVGAIAGFAAGAITAGIGTAELVIWSKRKKLFATAEEPEPASEAMPATEEPAPAAVPDSSPTTATVSAPAETQPPGATSEATSAPAPETAPATTPDPVDETDPATDAPAPAAPPESAPQPTSMSRIEETTSASLSISPGIAGWMMTLRF